MQTNKVKFFEIPEMGSVIDLNSGNIFPMENGQYDLDEEKAKNIGELSIEHLSHMKKESLIVIAKHCYTEKKE